MQKLNPYGLKGLLHELKKSYSIPVRYLTFKHFRVCSASNEIRSVYAQLAIKFVPHILLCNGGQHYVPYRWLLISNKLCDSTLCTCGGVGGGRCIMLIMTLETNIKFASAGDQTGSPASQGGTLPKELSRQLIL